MGGINPSTGKAWTLYETIAGGYGGRPGLDGIDGIHVHMTNTMNTPVEALEAGYPLRFLSYQLRPDTGGPGKWRGGCGVERSWMLLSSSATLSVLGERHKLRPWGLYGGQPGGLGEYMIKKADGSTLTLRSKCTVKISHGDAIIIRTPGGGGYGDPFERDPGLVQRDVANGLVSTQSAKHDYGVVIDQDNMSLDLPATNRLRKRRRR